MASQRIIEKEKVVSDECSNVNKKTKGIFSDYFGYVKCCSKGLWERMIIRISPQKCLYTSSTIFDRHDFRTQKSDIKIFSFGQQNTIWKIVFPLVLVPTSFQLEGYNPSQSKSIILNMQLIFLKEVITLSQIYTPFFHHI